MHTLLLATNNAGKIQEYMSLLKGIPFEIVTPFDMGITTLVEENGDTYEENARIKACTLAKESHLLKLADDSGLEVDALNGEPGVMSARYAGEGASDADRVKFLLDKLKNVPEKKRTARFRCVIALAEPDGNVEFYDGECKGIITFAPRGENGFGYDPIFYFPELGKTMAELSFEVKNRISHRSKAAQKARLKLHKIAAAGC